MKNFITPREPPLLNEKSLQYLKRTLIIGVITVSVVVVSVVVVAVVVV